MTRRSTVQGHTLNKGMLQFQQPSTNWTWLFVGGTTRQQRINPTTEGSNSPLERWASGSNLSLNILTKGNSTGGRIPHPRRTICRGPARRPVHEDGGDPRRRGVLDGGRRRGSLGSSTVGGGTPPWAARQRARDAGARERDQRAGGRRMRAKGRMANGGE